MYVLLAQTVYFPQTNTSYGITKLAFSPYVYTMPMYAFKIKFGIVSDVILTNFRWK